MRQDDALTSNEYLVQQGIFEALKDVHTMLPGFIEEFDPELQRATIRLSNAMELEDGTLIEMPPLINVPVQFPRWGDFVITLPVAKDDSCSVVFSERSLERFLEIGDNGKVGGEPRFHSLSDGFAIMGLSPKSKAIPNFSTDGLEIRNTAGTQKIVLDPSGNVEVHGGNFEVKNGDIDIETGVLKVQNTQVVGPQQPLIPPPAGGTIIDAQARAAISLILTTLQTHGLTL